MTKEEMKKINKHLADLLNGKKSGAKCAICKEDMLYANTDKDICEECADQYGE